MKSPFNKKAQKPIRNYELQPWWSGEFLAFLENLNLGEIEFLGFLEFLSFWFCWSSRAFGFGAAEFLGFLENPKTALS